MNQPLEGTLLPAGLRTSKVRASLDFETYSEAGFLFVDPPPPPPRKVLASGKLGALRWTPPYKVVGAGAQGKGGLPVVGTPNYVCHPTAEVLSLYYDLKDGNGRVHWVPAMPPPEPLLNHVRNGGELEAFNITFEWWVWNVLCVRRHGWPELPLEQCHCVMAKSRRFSLPGALGKVADVLGTTPKDKEGTRLIQKLTRPHTPTKSNPTHRWTPATAWDDFLSFYRYNEIDVESEDEVAALIPDLTDAERNAWLVDQRINARGLNVDVQALDAALDVLGQAEQKYAAELAHITDGAVCSVNETEKFRAWLKTRFIILDDLQKETVAEKVGELNKLYAGMCDADEWDGQTMPNSFGGEINPGHRALQIRAMMGAANVKKLRSLKLQVSSDGRLRDQYMYCGADRTGRASAGGVQLQNMTAKGPKSRQCSDVDCGRYFGAHHVDTCPHCGSALTHAVPEWDVNCVESAIADILMRDLARIEQLWGDVIAVLCGCLRGLFTAREGHDLICVDFSAIEAVVAACLSRCQWRIDVFCGHGKIYEESAAKATGIPFEEIIAYKEKNGMHHPARKTIGKVRELANGYGGWIGANKDFGAGDFMTDEEIKEDVLKWRAESPEIVEMWGGQYRETAPGSWEFTYDLHGLEGCAIMAIRNPGQCYAHIDITYAVYDDVLYCRLPSGRFLHYHRPRLLPTEDKLRRDEKTGIPAVKITFEGYNSNAAKGPVGWFRLETYGGRLFENVVQATAADLQFDALGRCERSGYPIVLHTHDEGAAEVPEGSGSLEQMEAIFAQRPDWASWWPIRAAGWRHKRYQKD